MPRLATLLMLTALPALAGCGSVVNYWGAEKDGVRERQQWGTIYGGVRNHCELARSNFGPRAEDATLGNRALTAGLLAVDLPLCVVADTLFLPYTIRYTRRCRALTDRPRCRTCDGIPIVVPAKSDDTPLPANSPLESAEDAPSTTS